MEGIISPSRFRDFTSAHFTKKTATAQSDLRRRPITADRSGQRRPIRHCEEPLRRSNPCTPTYAAPAIQTIVLRPLDCFASLAMTDGEIGSLVRLDPDLAPIFQTNLADRNVMSIAVSWTTAMPRACRRSRRKSYRDRGRRPPINGLYRVRGNFKFSATKSETRVRRTSSILMLLGFRFSP